MTDVNKDLINKIIEVNDIFLKFSEKHIFINTNMTPTQFNILGYIVKNDGIYINELKEKLIISPPALSQILNRMEQSGFITRELGKSDKREILLIPSPETIQMYHELETKYNTLLSERLQQIKDKDKEIMIKFLDYIKNVF